MGFKPEAKRVARFPRVEALQSVLISNVLDAFPTALSLMYEMGSVLEGALRLWRSRLSKKPIIAGTHVLALYKCVQTPEGFKT